MESTTFARYPESIHNAELCLIRAERTLHRLQDDLANAQSAPDLLAADLTRMRGAVWDQTLAVDILRAKHQRLINEFRIECLIWRERISRIELESGCGL